jgi:hypothetical protein
MDRRLLIDPLELGGITQRFQIPRRGFRQTTELGKRLRGEAADKAEPEANERELAKHRGIIPVIFGGREQSRQPNL